MEGEVIRLTGMQGVILLGTVTLSLAVLVGSIINLCRAEQRKQEEDKHTEARTLGWRDNAPARSGRLELYDSGHPGEPVLTARLSVRSLRRILSDFEEGRLS